MRRRRVAAGAVAVAAAVTGGTAFATGAFGSGGEDPPPASAPVPATAEVTRADLVDRVDESGTLGYGDTSSIGARQEGTITWLPAEGATIGRGGTLYRVDERPVPLLLGTVPAYRRLAAGSEGEDVRQLEKNLRALGYDGFTVDDEYTSATAAAVEDWQDDLGVDETGTVDPGDVVFAPAPVRVAELKAALGDRAAPGGEVLGVTGTARVVTVDLPVADQRLARKGAAVTVEVPAGEPVRGTITSVGTVAELPESEEPQDDRTEDATVAVTIALAADAAGTGGVDQAPVTVGFTVAERKAVLSVPVAALLALAEGGYGVELVTGGSTKVVAVETGLFADGRVEVSGAGIAEGARVGVPAT